MNALGNRHSEPADVVSVDVYLTGMNAGTDLQAHGGQRVAEVERCLDGAARPVEQRNDSVASRGRDLAPVQLDNLRRRRIVARDLVAPSRIARLRRR